MALILSYDIGCLPLNLCVIKITHTKLKHCHVLHVTVYIMPLKDSGTYPAMPFCEWKGSFHYARDSEPAEVAAGGKERRPS